MTHVVTATPCLNGELSPAMRKSLRFNGMSRGDLEFAVSHATIQAMDEARKFGVSFDDTANTIVLSFVNLG